MAAGSLKIYNPKLSGLVSFLAVTKEREIWGFLVTKLRSLPGWTKGANAIKQIDKKKPALWSRPNGVKWSKAKPVFPKKKVQTVLRTKNPVNQLGGDPGL